MPMPTITAANTVEAGGEIYETHNILIATGSVPAVPPIPGINSEAVLDSTGILELMDVPEALVIIGGGVIGLEFAGFFAELGTGVTVVEMLPKIAPVIDGEIAKRLQTAMKKLGVTPRRNARSMTTTSGTHSRHGSGAARCWLLSWSRRR